MRTLCAGSAPLSLAAVNTAWGSRLWTAGPAALLLGLGEGKNKVLLPPLCREPGADASAVCCIQHKALILLCCQYTFVGEASIPWCCYCCLRADARLELPISLPTWVYQAGTAVGLLEPEKRSCLLIFALETRAAASAWPLQALLVSQLCSPLSCAFWDSSVSAWGAGRQLGQTKPLFLPAMLAALGLEAATGALCAPCNGRDMTWVLPAQKVSGVGSVAHPA